MANRLSSKDVFINEARSLIEKAQNSLIDLENNPDDTDKIDSIMRLMHTIKGGASLEGFNQISDLSHKMESIFIAIKNRDILATIEILDTLFQAIDTITEILNGSDISDTSDLINKLNDFLPIKKQTTIEASLILEVDDLNNIIAIKGSDKRVYRINIDLSSDPNPNLNIFIIYNALKGISDLSFFSPAENLLMSGEKFAYKADMLIVSSQDRIEIENIIGLNCNNFDIQELTTDELRKEFIKEEKEDKEAKSEDKKHKQTKEELILEVEKVLVESLLSTLGEYLVEINELQENYSNFFDKIKNKLSEEEIGTGQMLFLLLTSVYSKSNMLFDISMKMRLRSIQPILSTLPKMVRDISRKIGKKIKLEIHNKDIKVAPEIMEPLSASLLHIIRNSIDHGIEAPDLRKKLGKPVIGKIKITVDYQGEKVMLIVQDDGKGLSTIDILNRAVSHGVITKGQGATMSKKEIFSLVFLPGFSTREEAGELSGRGVGMDVVKKNIEKMGGSIELISEEGKGTEIRLLFPFLT